MEEKKSVDLKFVQNMIGDNLELFATLVKVFSEDGETQVESIEKAIIDACPEALDSASHSFKSSLATLGASKASGLAGQLEALGKSCIIEGADEVYKKLTEEYLKVKKYFESRQWEIDWNNAE